MENSLGKYLIQNQKLSITPNMVEYLKVLQIPGIDLERYIEEEMRENPMLERELPAVDSLAGNPSVAPFSDELITGSTRSSSDDYSSDKYLSGDFSNGKYTSDNFSNSVSSAGTGRLRDEKGAAEKALQFMRKKTTLKEYLLRQLSEMKVDQLLRKITAFMIESLDDDGYFRESTRDIERMLKVESRYVRSALKLLQGMEPSGVGARNLKECLLIQLARKRLLTEENKNIIIFHFELLVRKNYSEISKKTGVPVKNISGLNNLLKQLNPKPGSAFTDSGWGTYVVPDLILVETDDGYAVQYNDEAVPTVRINNYYRNLLKDPNSTPETKEYIKKSFSRATGFIRAIEQRRQTILDTAGFIIDYQKESLKSGNRMLRPLTMKVVAEGLGISESTVSRAVSGKFIQTPRGALELKSFFSSRLGETDNSNRNSNSDANNYSSRNNGQQEISSDAGSFSSASVMDMIKKIIAGENKQKPVSDEQIRKQLDERGIKIARRTIAKYRDEMGILPTSLRKSGTA